MSWLEPEQVYFAFAPFPFSVADFAAPLLRTIVSGIGSTGREPWPWKVRSIVVGSMIEPTLPSRLPPSSPTSSPTPLRLRSTGQNTGDWSPLVQVVVDCSRVSVSDEAFAELLPA